MGPGRVAQVIDVENGKLVPLYVDAVAKIDAYSLLCQRTPVSDDFKLFR